MTEAYQDQLKTTYTILGHQYAPQIFIMVLHVNTWPWLIAYDKSIVRHTYKYPLQLLPT